MNPAGDDFGEETAKTDRRNELTQTRLELYYALYENLRGKPNYNISPS